MPLTVKGKMQSILDNLLVYDNNCILVDSGEGNDSNSGKNTWNNALATWDAAYAKCTENNGDKILLAPGHAETWSTTGIKVTGDKEGVEVIALGEGADKATITITHTGAYATFTADSQAVKGVRFVSGVDSIVKFVDISGSDCDIDIETFDTTDIEVITDVVNSGDRNKIKVNKHGYLLGDANDCVISCNGCSGADLEVVGELTDNITSIIEFVTAASSNINIKLSTLVTGITDLSQNVVDTITGSTYNAIGFDKGAGANFIGNESGLEKDASPIILGNNNIIKTTIADGTTINNNTQTSAGLLATATGDVLIEEITVQRGATDFVGPTNLEFTVDNANGLTGVDAPLGVLPLADFNANKTTILSLDGSTKQLPFVLEDGKKLYIHGDDAVVSAGGSTDFYTKFKGIGSSSAKLT